METYQILISLKNSKPIIWRRILISSGLSLSDFHKVIQTTMGWTNSHLHQFIKNNTFYTVRMGDDDFWEEMNNVDYKGMKVSDLLVNEDDTIIYEYDFGDGWMHDLTLEKKITNDPKIIYPSCLTGKMNCPPEDCGGVWGYEDLLKIIKNPEHEEYEGYMEWLGGAFDPKDFNKDEINKRLKTKNFGCSG
jgi:hypothetical protein